MEGRWGSSQLSCHLLMTKCLSQQVFHPSVSLFVFPLIHSSFSRSIFKTYEFRQYLFVLTSPASLITGLLGCGSMFDE